MLKVGIDIGGTKIAGGVVDHDGRIIEKVRVDTPADTRALADAVIDMARHFRAGHEVAAVGRVRLLEAERRRVMPFGYR